MIEDLPSPTKERNSSSDLLQFIPNSYSKRKTSQRVEETKKMFNIARTGFRQKLQRLYQFPASVNAAKVHQRAYKSGYKSAKSLKMQNKGEVKDSEQKLVNTLMCPCC